MVQLNTIGDWSSIALIVGTIFSMLFSMIAIIKANRKRDDNTYARKDIVDKDFSLINKRMDNHEEMNKMEFNHFRELLEEVRCTAEDMNSKIDILIQRK